MERENKRIGNANHAFHSLQFKVEDRLECGSSKQVILVHNECEFRLCTNEIISWVASRLK